MYLSYRFTGALHWSQNSSQLELGHVSGASFAQSCNQLGKNRIEIRQGKKGQPARNKSIINTSRQLAIRICGPHSKLDITVCVTMTG